MYWLNIYCVWPKITGLYTFSFTLHKNVGRKMVNFPGKKALFVSVIILLHLISTTFEIFVFWKCLCPPSQYEFSPQTLCCYGKQLCTISRDGTYYSYQNRYLHAELCENDWMQCKCTSKAIVIMTTFLYISIRLIYLQNILYV